MSCDGNVLKLSKAACMYALVHTLSTISTQESSQTDNGSVNILKSIYSLNSRAILTTHSADRHTNVHVPLEYVPESAISNLKSVQGFLFVVPENKI